MKRNIFFLFLIFLISQEVKPHIAKEILKGVAINLATNYIMSRATILVHELAHKYTAQLLLNNPSKIFVSLNPFKYFGYTTYERSLENGYSKAAICFAGPCCGALFSYLLFRLAKKIPDNAIITKEAIQILSLIHLVGELCNFIPTTVKIGDKNILTDGANIIECFTQENKISKADHKKSRDFIPGLSF
jgi:hypothetical protein